MHVSTEGQFTDVRSVRLPASVLEAMDPAATPSSSPSASTEEPVTISGSGTIEESGDPWLWLAGGAVLAGFVAIGGWLLIRRGSAS